jgi:hypothetical protein
MINKNIVIAALARDCEQSLRVNIPLIESFRKQFLSSQVVVIENDSIDRTKDLLNDWKLSSNQVTIISNDYETNTIPSKSDSILNPMTSSHRIEKMLSYRNQYLDYISDLNQAIDFVIVIDIDVSEISMSGLIHVINAFDDKTGAIFSNGISVKQTVFGLSEIYYDIFALYEYPQKDEYSYSPECLGRTFKSINKKIKREPFYKVISAFGGVGVYNYQAIKGLRYKNVLNPLNEKESICEHIPFNQEIIRRGFNNYIARDFKVFYGKHNWILILKLFLPVKAFIFLYPNYLKVKNWIRK